MKYGSVCSGIEAASVAWHSLGWSPAWLSEIDEFPSAVLAHHFPDVANLGDMTKLPAKVLSGAIDAPDILVGGTPCQAFSVAGLREGLDDPRGQLTIKYVELFDAIDYVRASRGAPPCIAVYENVPGVLSDKSNAFGCFLGALSGEDCELQSPGGKWANAGCVFGPQRTVAWRILDAQYFGLAQRRRRVFVVASARKGFHPAQVLFEFDGMRRDTPPSREAGEGITHTASSCLTRSGRGVERVGDTRGQYPVVAVAFQPGNLARGAGAAPSEDVFPTLKADHGRGLSDQMPHVLCMAHGQGGAEVASERSPTLTCNHEAPIVVHGTQDPCVSVDKAFALGRNNGGENVIALQDVTGREKAQNGKGYNDEGVAYTVDTHATQGVAIPLLEVGKRTGVSTTDRRAGLGVGHDGDPMFTLQAGAQHGVAIAFAQNTRDEVRLIGGDGQISGALAAQPGMKQTSYVAYAFQPRIGRNGRGDMGDVVSALTAQAGDTGKGDASPCVATPMAVRRLTPRECERLQGFPDDWTLIPVRGKSAADGPRYKALGNSMAVPVMRWIGQRIQMFIQGVSP